VSQFPDPRSYGFPEWVLVGDYFYYARDIVAFDIPLTVENLRAAYLSGIFPWHIRRVPLPWFCPERRAILELDELHVSRSLEKLRRKQEFSFSIDRDFSSVIESCARARRPDQNGTWITSIFIEQYTRLHREGMAHSIEAWDSRGKLVGGLYGVDAGGVFCGESMFYARPNASKLALLYLIDHLRSRGSSWLDVQVMTDHMQALGAKEIDRTAFLDKLKETQALGLRLF
jgi:leucyl/phenylalanyl-tRNA--protein transferase